ncbi:MAG: zinc ABC transporter substrate-binding protein [Victivallaceae bacterium]|nr:zinc ABC transporter substrate-binding protein [Victivallaceae bacterium]
MPKFFIRLSLLAILFGAAGCSDAPEQGKPCVAAGIAPVAFIAQEIAGDQYEVAVLLPPGKNPHDYAPGPREIARAAKSPLFLTAGMPFEARLGAVFGDGTKIIDVARTLPHRKMEDKHHHHEEEGDHHHEGENDPHVWLSPDLDIAMAEIVCDALVQTFPGDAATFRANAAALKEKFAEKKEATARKLATRREREFFVYHAAFGYFADAFGLRQIAVECGGRESDPAQLGRIIRKMRRRENPVLFVQKEFSPAAGRALQQQCGARLVEVDPLEGDLFALFDTLADALEPQKK